MKDGHEWSQKQMNTMCNCDIRFSPQVQGHRIAGQEIPILTNTCTRAQDCWTEIPIFDLQKGKCLIHLCKMLDTKAVVGPPSAMRTSDHTTEIPDMPRLNG